MSAVDMEQIVSLAKRRGFIFQSSEIYGGLASTYDYGPYGVELKRNVKEAWWKENVRERDDMVGLDAAILMAPEVWVSSGHVEGFTDPLVECKNCHQRFRADHIENDSCPECNGELTEERQFNLMFKTTLGPVEEEGSIAYLRPETAQGIFVNFANVQTTTRRKPPFGIAQIGKAFRNEITTGNFIFRMREFEQMEIEFFVPPEEALSWHAHWKETRLAWFKRFGVNPNKLRMRDHDPEELAHYSQGTSDIEYEFPFGWGEIEGVAHRGDYDLKQHQEHSGKPLTYFDPEKNEHYLPHVIEPSVGVDRALLTFLVDAYMEEKVRDEKRTVLRLHKDLAPIKVAILPLSRNEKLVPKAREVLDIVRGTGAWFVEYDDAQSIGRRYRRQDEIGTPLCVTVDFQTVEEDDSVTIRDRDTMEQIRVPISNLLKSLSDQLS